MNFITVLQLSSEDFRTIIMEIVNQNYFLLDLVKPKAVWWEIQIVDKANKVFIFMFQFSCLSSYWRMKDKNNYHKVASSRLSWLVAHPTVHVGEIWCLCTVTFCPKSSKLNSRPVYCSRLYGNLKELQIGTNFSLRISNWFCYLFFYVFGRSSIWMCRISNNCFDFFMVHKVNTKI